MTARTSPFRRLGRAGLSLLVAATSTSLLWAASAGTASAGTIPGAPCDGGRCVASFGPAASPQDFQVPVGVTSVTAEVVGASGGDQQGAASGGSGGGSRATIQVSPEETLRIVVGERGRDAGSDNGGDNRPGGSGGGGVGGYDLAQTSGGASGGGGSFIFGANARLLVVSGGGGGASGARRGGQGGSAETPAGAGQDADLGATGGRPADTDGALNGDGGAAGSRRGTPGAAGTGQPVSATTLPVGGGGGDSWVFPGGGGGGGFYAGGGGGGASDDTDGGGGGGGGAGFAAGESDGVTAVSGAPATEHGDGSVVLRWAQPLQFTSTPTDPAVGRSYPVTVASAFTGKPVVLSIDPRSMAGACTIDGALVTFLHVGTCVVAADQEGDETHVAGHRVQSISVGRGSQAITFPELPTPAVPGTTHVLQASGGPSGYPVEYVVTQGADRTCSVNGDQLTYLAAGPCVVRASQEASYDYYSASPVSRSVNVQKETTTTALELQPTTAVYGQYVSAVADVTSTSAYGTVRFFVDGSLVSTQVTSDDGRANALIPPPLGGGGHLVKAVFTPKDAAHYTGSQAEQTLAVAKAPTATTITVRDDKATAVVTATSYGWYAPEGEVVFTVGGVDHPVTLSGGRATLPEPFKTARTISVKYAGNENYSPSSDSTSQTDPTIEAEVTSKVGVSRAGWYRTPVTVGFTCTEGSAAIVGACPADVVLDRDGASQDVTRTIEAEDGGIATVSVTGINIDQTGPDVRVLGVESGKRYFAVAPQPSCEAEDSLSGVQRCTAGVAVHGQTLTYAADAVDRADNVSRATVQAEKYSYGFLDAPYAKGVYTVRAGHTYTLVANNRHRAQVLEPTSTSKKPSRKGAKLKDTSKATGLHTWALGYRIGAPLKPGRTYNLGIRTACDRHIIKIHVVR